MPHNVTIIHTERDEKTEFVAKIINYQDEIVFELPNNEVIKIDKKTFKIKHSSGEKITI